MDTAKNSNAVIRGKTCDSCWLNCFSVFETCSEKLQDQVIRNIQTRKYAKGEKLIKAGDRGKGIFCIQSGMVKVCKIQKRNKDFTLWIAGAGDVIGLNSLVNDEPFEFSASSIDEVTACFIPAFDLRLVLQNDPAISVQLMKRLCDKLDFIEQRITSMARKKVREQCAEMLIFMVAQNKAESNKSIQINYSIKELASLIGTTKTYLYKVILDFKKKNVIAIRSRKIIINNMHALYTIAVGSKNLGA